MEQHRELSESGIIPDWCPLSTEDPRLDVALTEPKAETEETLILWGNPPELKI